MVRSFISLIFIIAAKFLIIKYSFLADLIGTKKNSYQVDNLLNLVD